MTPKGFDVDSNPLDALVAGCKGVFMCAGYEKQEPETIGFMVNAGLAVMSAASKNTAVAQTCVVLTSSTGSTNPPGAPSDAIKNETDFLSDPEVQRQAFFGHFKKKTSSIKTQIDQLESE